jgi:hypothetical protein
LLRRRFGAAEAFYANQGGQIAQQLVTIDSVQDLSFTRRQHRVIVNQNAAIGYQLSALKLKNRKLRAESAAR